MPWHEMEICSRWADRSDIVAVVVAEKHRRREVVADSVRGIVVCIQRDREGEQRARAGGWMGAEGKLGITTLTLD